MPLCPCRVSPSLSFLTTPIAYSDCCQPYHDAVDENNSDDPNTVKADSAERLMRTRYSAFVLQKADYIVKTTVPAQQTLLDIKDIESWAQETDWAGLEIVKHLPKLGKGHAQVEFKAYYNSAEGIKAHHELSSFVRIDERWYFLDPTVAMTISQKQPCLCGSGEKFKRCCGGYLP
ncbi:YchJ family protein [Psychrobacter sp. TAE2020]|uniref:YchJ family protein n=1 Tax=Psychrobacter sp. TAE2020 TaxID=2846762 RepID=UPI001C0F6B30|nr:YchJ family protein [Psychrobacter sp. TAE2020]MBU5617224.1 YchJ family protein [Psychrobacter sp. TAE2020]